MGASTQEKHRDRRGGHAGGSKPSQHALQKRRNEVTHFVFAGGHNHHRRHQRYGDNTIENGAPQQRAYGVKGRIVHRHAYEGGKADHCVEPDRLARLVLETDLPAAGLCRRHKRLSLPGRARQADQCR